MWHIYIFVAVLLRGTYCNPLKITADLSQCNIVIKRFNEPVTKLEVKWGSTIHLDCDASCVQAGAQPGLAWFYRDRKLNKDINIEKLFRAQKFETYPTYFRRKNELIIRNFGENEETTFICKGSIARNNQTAEVELRGTDCPLKYSFRCQVDKKCIDRSYLCNYRDDCPDGEDEKHCGDRIETTTMVSKITSPEKDVQTKKSSTESDYDDISTTVSKTTSRKIDVETKQPSTESDYVDISTTVPTMRSREIDVETKQPSTESHYVDIRTTVSTVKSREIDVETKQPSTKYVRLICLEGKKACKDFSACIDDFQYCDGIHDCADSSDENDCSGKGLVCVEGKKACKDLSKCIDSSQLCNGVQDCTDGGDEINCSPEKENLLITGMNIDDIYIEIEGFAATTL